ncbi:outer membrane beta-barrel protein [Hyphomicrobium sp. NDB2Meth4]|uniref:outer membrane protein n=1 Tax=Hyphomicrobium sp. NDB2Meth4 TaxID=1892846 RepID=UPI00092FDC41|nr:outer membrane beta-barrel protein [Hyphomicrobium sp. NDB2Meth4]
MLRLTLGLTFALAIAGSALADGYEDPKSFKAPAAPIWSGIYLGAGAGYGQASTRDDYSENVSGDTFSTSFSGQSAQGGLIRFLLGADRQIKEKFVLGVFADFDWTDISQTYKATATGSSDAIDDELTMEWQWSIGGRAGYLFTPTTMLYFLAGFTQAHFKSDGWYDIYPTSGPIDVLPGKSSITYNGYVVGFGMETLIGHNVFLRGEMRYSEFDGQVVNSGTLFGDSYSDSEHPSLLTGMLGLTYKFNRAD